MTVQADHVYRQPQGSEHCVRSVHSCCSSSGRSSGSTYMSDRHSFSHCHCGSYQKESKH